MLVKSFQNVRDKNHEEAFDSMDVLSLLLLFVLFGCGHFLPGNLACIQFF